MPRSLTTHCGEVEREAIVASESALQKHVADVVARSVIEISHVELLGLEVDKIGLFLQSSKDFWLC